METPVLTARPTVYQGVQMRSRLEARFASFLDAAHVAWTYEPRAYRGKAGEYLPDFQIGDRTFIEIKPAFEHDSELHKAQWQAINKADQILTEAVPAAWLWIVRSNGFSFGWAVVGDGFAYGHLALCEVCFHISIRLRYSSDPVCAWCAMPLRGIENWLGNW